MQCVFKEALQPADDYEWAFGTWLSGSLCSS